MRSCPPRPRRRRNEQAEARADSFVSEAGSHCDDCGFGAAGGRESGHRGAGTAGASQPCPAGPEGADGGRPDSGGPRADCDRGGFRLAPRINAAGRMDIASDVVELFLTKDAAARARACRETESIERRSPGDRGAGPGGDRAQLGSFADWGAVPSDCIILDDPAWHRGVLGILASRVVDRTGTARACSDPRRWPGPWVGPVDCRLSSAGCPDRDSFRPERLVAPAASALFTRFGGHAHAVGFSLPSDRVELLRARMQRYGAPCCMARCCRLRWTATSRFRFRELTAGLLRVAEALWPLWDRQS